VWSAPGFVAALAIVMPWRRGLRRALLFVGVAGVSMLALCGYKLLDLLVASGSVKDGYIYFDATVDPAYFAMWRGGLPGKVGVWPPPGELGGVGLFTIVLCAGLAAALLLGRRDPVVLVVACCFGGAWLMRFYYASRMFRTGDVRLYPRTSMEILHCLLLLTLLAAVYGWQRVRPRLVPAPGAVVSGTALASGLVAGGCALVLLLGSAASATVDTYLPRDDGSIGHLAWNAQVGRMPDGRCSVYLRPNCRTPR
jgi:galactan 5-O-arabinofuranosyltransferase